MKQITMQDVVADILENEDLPSPDGKTFSNRRAGQPGSQAGQEIP